MNSNGPSLDPWGMPAITSLTSDLTPSTTVTCLLLVKYDLKSQSTYL